VSATAAPVLDVRGLTLDFGDVRVLHGVDLHVYPGETLAVVGESGSGKSAASLAIMGLHDPRTARTGGAVVMEGAAGPQELLGLSPRALRAVRGREIAMIFQEPMTSLNPVQRVGTQIAEGLRLHRGLAGTALEGQVRESLREVGIPDPERRARAFPHELSGGMRQRVLIALALACNPRLLIADEPTTALDVTVQAQILDLLRRIQQARGMGLLFITHSMGVVAEIADRVAVMYGGRIVETAPAAQLFAHPRHPYTRALLGSLPEAAGDGPRRRLRTIPGSVIDLRNPPPGCAFQPRCDMPVALCAQMMPQLDPVAPARASRCHRWTEL